MNKTKELNVGDIIYVKNDDYFDQKLIIARVTKTKAVAGSGKEFHRKYYSNQVNEKKSRSRYSGFYRAIYSIETPEIKIEYKRVHLINKISKADLHALDLQTLALISNLL